MPDHLATVPSTTTMKINAVLMSMALESKGVAWLPKSLTEQEMADGRLVRALDESWDIPLEIHLTRPTAAICPSAEEFWAKLSG